uniref:Poly [ADP-ribose] polymerase n=1 Tax=Graphocephala atropunctata TaxID=36148 RepID=A0A1B6LXM5_9HEMI
MAYKYDLGLGLGASPSTSRTMTHESSMVCQLTPGPQTENLVEPSSAEKAMVKSMISSTFPNIHITDIKKVDNSFLKAMYLVKKEEYKSRNQRVEEKTLLHVTGADNVKSIFKNNFDWRLVSRGKFGQGTSFSNDAKYANRYANQSIGNRRAFIITKVLVSNEIGGNYGLKVPMFKYDTTTGNGNKVFVKFCDNETLPSFVAYYNSNDLSRAHHVTVDFDDYYDLSYSDLDPFDFCDSD